MIKITELARRQFEAERAEKEWSGDVGLRVRFGGMG